MWLRESAIRSPHAAPLKPPNTSEWMTPSRAQASIETGGGDLVYIGGRIIDLRQGRALARWDGFLGEFQRAERDR